MEINIELEKAHEFLKSKNIPLDAVWYKFYIDKMLLEFAEQQVKASNIHTPKFKLPTDKEVIEMALLFNYGKLERDKLTDMVAMCQCIIDRLYETGDISKPSSKEGITDSDIKTI